jgi:hypothetical protein
MPVIEQCVHVHDKKDGFAANLIFKDITTVHLDVTVLKRAYPSIIANVFGKLKNDDVNGKMTYPMVMAPYISIDSEKQCEQLNIGYMDMSGNCRILIGSLYVRDKGPNNKFSKKRLAKTIFDHSSKISSVILREIMRDVTYQWKLSILIRKT